MHVPLRTQCIQSRCCIGVTPEGLSRSAENEREGERAAMDCMPAFWCSCVVTLPLSWRCKFNAAKWEGCKWWISISFAEATRRSSCCSATLIMTAAIWGENIFPQRHNTLHYIKNKTSHHGDCAEWCSRNGVAKHLNNPCTVDWHEWDTTDVTNRLSVTSNFTDSGRTLSPRKVPRKVQECSFM